MRLEFTHSHIYQRATASLTGEQAEPGERATCLVQLSDGVVLSTSCLIQVREIILSMPDYLTARGAKISAKDWLTRRDLETGAWKAKSKVAV
jgi:hypothetical protein